jgi:hypothetical protein
MAMDLTSKTSVELLYIIIYSIIFLLLIMNLVIIFVTLKFIMD